MNRKGYYISEGSKVHHNASCICLSMHGQTGHDSHGQKKPLEYKQVGWFEARGKKACGICGGGS